MKINKKINKKVIAVNMLFFVLGIFIAMSYSALGATTTPKAIMLGIVNAEALPDNTLKLDILYTSTIDGALDFSIGTAVIDPNSDTSQAISAKITNSIIDDLSIRGITIIKGDIIIQGFQKGS